MKVLVLGASGAIGRELLPQLAAAGHVVAGSSRTSAGAEMIPALGAQAISVDVLDESSISAAIERCEPDAVINEVTSIPRQIDTRRVDRDFEQTNLLRSQGTANVLAAIAGSGAKVITQSVAFAYAPGPAGVLHVESDPLDLAGIRSSAGINRAVAAMEDAVRAAGGTALRYGYFYGPGTAFSRRGSSGEAVAKRRFPIVGNGDGVWSFIHVRDAASATVSALDGPAGTYNVVDDSPARVGEWLPAFARALGAPAPRRVPVWLARIAAGSYGANAMTAAQGASNALARSSLHWAPRLPDVCEGFTGGLDE